MNRTDRLLALVLELQARKNCRAEDLAAVFETSKRTIYRDIQALCEAGVPVVAIPGQGYSLAEGYFLPPLTFSADEAAMLLLGSDFVANSFDEEYRAVSLTARRKIAGVLPERLSAEVARRQNRIRLISTMEGDSEILKSLRRAVIDNLTVSFEYHGRAGEPVRREVDPYGLVYFDGTWYLSAYCHLRQGRRNFRLERITRLNFTGKTFAPPANFDLRNGSSGQERSMVIKVLFDISVARWVRESRNFYVSHEEEVEGGLLVTLTVRRENDVLAWILGWGRKAIVLEPESLRRKIAEEAIAISEIYQNRSELLT